MKIGILGTGDVGRALAAALAKRGHEVMLGTRDIKRKMAETTEDPETPSLADWLKQNPQVRLGRFSDAAAHGEMLFNATAGYASIEALAKVNPADLKQKILVDIANALGPWGEGPVSLFVSNNDSLAERIQRAHPDTRLVKALNTVTAHLMTAPRSLAGGDHDVFVAGNDPEARGQVSGFLRDEFGWNAAVDLGDLSAARGMEMMIMLWVNIWTALGTDRFNFKVVR
jgi:predicted dinucleotide-binding enzyme